MKIGHFSICWIKNKFSKLQIIHADNFDSLQMFGPISRCEEHSENCGSWIKYMQSMKDYRESGLAWSVAVVNKLTYFYVV